MKIEIKEIKNTTPRKIELYADVRIKRKGEYYFVFVSDTYLIHDQKYALSTTEAALNRFHDMCLLTKYLYRVPENLEKHKDNIIKDHSVLTDKETFLFNHR